MRFPRRRTPHRLLLSATVAVLAPPFSLPGQTGLPAGPGADLAHAKCQGCHSLDVVTNSAGIARPMWEGVMEEMKVFGMQVTADEDRALTDYLATYLGPDPPPEPDKRPTPAASSTLDGSNLYDRHCSACHGKDGAGVAGQIPPLAGNPYLFKDRFYSVSVLLYGLQGPIEIKGRSYEGVMPGFSHLSDPEIAAIANYVVEAWGNRESLTPDFEAIGPDLLGRVRTKMPTPKEVRKRRSGLR